MTAEGLGGGSFWTSPEAFGVQCGYAQTACEITLSWDYFRRLVCEPREGFWPNRNVGIQSAFERYLNGADFGAGSGLTGDC
jgi:hypothetical protein